MALDLTLALLMLWPDASWPHRYVCVCVLVCLSVEGTVALIAMLMIQNSQTPQKAS